MDYIKLTICQKTPKKVIEFPNYVFLPRSFNLLKAPLKFLDQVLEINLQEFYYQGILSSQEVLFFRDPSQQTVIRRNCLGAKTPESIEIAHNSFLQKYYPGFRSSIGKSLTEILNLPSH